MLVSWRDPPYGYITHGPDYTLCFCRLVHFVTYDDRIQERFEFLRGPFAYVGRVHSLDCMLAYLCGHHPGAYLIWCV